MNFLTLTLLATIVGSSTAVNNQTWSSEGRSIQFIDLNTGLSEGFVENVAKLFFIVYPQEKQAYNNDSPNDVVITFDPNYSGVCECYGNRIKCGSKYFLDNPEDIDAVTHELMHVVQFRRSGADWTISGPNWLTEGIADYARAQFGIQKEASRWFLPRYQAGQSYTDGYRVTAAFFMHLERQYNGIVKKIFDVQYVSAYNDNIWESLTGQTLQQLWTAYSQA